MPSPAQENVVMKPAENDIMTEVGEPSQPDDMPPGRQPGHQQFAHDKSANLPGSSSSNGGLAAVDPPKPLPQDRPTDDTDEIMSFGDASGTSFVSIPTQIQSNSLQASYDRRYSGASSASSPSLERADSTDSARRPPPRPLDVSRSVRNGAPTSPMPLYSQQLFGKQQLCCPSPGDSTSELEFEAVTCTPNIEQSLSSMKRKRPHPNDEAIEPSAADPEIVAATQDVLALLQMYGPLSYIQLKVNIETQFEEDDSASVKKLQKVLDILVELGIIHIVEDIDPGTQDSKPAASAQDDEEPESDTTKNNNPVYSFGSGARRLDAVLPSHTLDEINEAGNEISQTQQRIELLQSFLRLGKAPVTAGVDNRPAGIGSNPAPYTQEFARKALSQMIDRHPDLVHDPTYAAALRLFKVHDATNNNKTPGTEGSKRRKKGPVDSSAAIAESRTGDGSP
jgi:hypothetical protein